VFIRHIFPIKEKISLSGDKIADLKDIISALVVEKDYNGVRFNVQCRKIGKGLEYNPKDVEVCIGTELEKRGGMPIYKGEEVMSDDSLMIFSVFLTDSIAHVGKSLASDNLEVYADPTRFYSIAGRSICRSEFKLLEAINRFKIKLPSEGLALDLGASPGGWSNVLKNLGFDVTAVDPASLDSRVVGIKHFKGRAENFRSEEKFDILVNDMNLNPVDSARIVLSQVDNLKKHAYVILTIKFTRKNYERMISDVKEVLKKDFDVLSTKNLFHNHEEVTMLLMKK